MDDANEQAAPAPRRGEYRKTAQRREQILDAAFEVFARSGFSGATVTDIARAAGLTAPGVTHHFDGKLAILEGVLDRRDSSARAELEGRHGIDFLRALVTIAETNEDRREQVRFYTVIAAEATEADHPAHPFITRRFASVVEATAAAFEEAREAGDLRADVDPARAAATHVGLVEGLQLLWLHDQARVDIPSEVRAHLESFLTVPL